MGGKGRAEGCWNCRLAVTEYMGPSAVDPADFLGKFLSIGLLHDFWILWLLREVLHQKLQLHTCPAPPGGSFHLHSPGRVK